MGVCGCVGFVMCGFLMCGCVYVCRFCNVWVCVGFVMCGFLMCGCVYVCGFCIVCVCVCVCVGFVMCGFFNMCKCGCFGNICTCIYRVLYSFFYVYFFLIVLV